MKFLEFDAVIVPVGTYVLVVLGVHKCLADVLRLFLYIYINSLIVCAYSLFYLVKIYIEANCITKSLFVFFIFFLLLRVI
jgi:hypothetical protein